MTGDNVTCGLVKIQTTDNQPVALSQSFNTCAMLVSSFFIFNWPEADLSVSVYLQKRGLREMDVRKAERVLGEGFLETRVLEQTRFEHAVDDPEKVFRGVQRIEMAWMVQV